MIQYEGTLYRPPSEADSLILQATIGCSYNRCTFCAMYREKRFRVRPLDELAREIAWAREVMGDVRKVFLADGDALVAKARFLSDVLALLREAFPNLRRVSAYASPQSIEIRTDAELRQLREEGLMDRRRPLPRFPARVGVVTSRDADAWRDFTPCFSCWFS